MIDFTYVINEDLCRLLCYSESNCISYNFKTENETGQHKCELNNATHEVHEEDLEENPDYVYRGATVRMTLKLPILIKFHLQYEYLFTWKMAKLFYKL